MRNVKENLRTIEFQNDSKIRESLGVSSRRLNVHFFDIKIQEIAGKKLWSLGTHELGQKA